MSDEKFGQRPPVRLPDDPLSRSPIAELQRLAVNADSEQARVNALRLLLDRMDRQRDRDEAKAAAAAQEGESGDGGSSLREYVREVTGEALDNELDPLLAGTVEAALADPDDTGYPHLVAAFRRAVERHTAALEDVGRIEEEVQRRAEALAAEKYTRRDFAAAAPLQLDAAPDLLGRDQDEVEDDGEPGFTAQPPEHAEGGTEPDDRALAAGFPSRSRGRRLRPPSVEERMGR